MSLPSSKQSKSGSDNDPLLTGANNVSTSQYRNYVLFESSAHDPFAAPQIYMRYLGGI